MSVLSMLRRKRGPELQRGDVPYLNAVQAAQVMDPAPAAMWAVYLLLAAIAVAVGWASMAQVDIVAKADRSGDRGHADGVGSEEGRHGRDQARGGQRGRDGRLIPRGAQGGEAGQVLRGHRDQIERHAQPKDHRQAELGHHGHQNRRAEP